MLFGNKDKKESGSTGFSYLDKNVYYFDSACQTLRPQEVINAETEYYHKFNACGHRVKYEWGKLVDKKSDETRALLLELAGKSAKDYTVAFSLNTSHGIYLILHQLNPDDFNSVITSEIEHNSVFLNSTTWAAKHAKKRLVLHRSTDGSLEYDKKDLDKAVVIVNTASNIDGRELKNLKELFRDVHEAGGILLLDGAQTFGHNTELLKEVSFDAAFGSGHKMYGPSLGFIVIKKSLVRELDCYLIGGSTVSDVGFEDYELIDNDDELYSRIEPGLQNFAGIVGLGEAIKWRRDTRFSGLSADKYELELKDYLHQKLLKVKDLRILYPESSGVVSVYSEKHDSHQLGTFLGTKNIMCRTGYHCCHYYLKELKGYPPLLRISLGLNNTNEQIDFLVDNLSFILRNF